MSIIKITQKFVKIVVKCKSVTTVIIELMDITDIILINTIVRIIVCFQSGDEGTFNSEGLGASFRHSTS